MGSEIDNFAVRLHHLSDSKKYLNDFINQELLKAQEQVNYHRHECSIDRLTSIIHSQIAVSDFLGIGKFQKIINEDPNISKLYISRENSVYQDIGFFDGIALYLYGLDYIIRVGNHYVGTDKLGHFLSDGWRYYHKAYILKKGVDSALSYGHSSEESILGKLTTGIFSYADLSVNFNGMRFWAQIHGGIEDVLGTKHTLKPYFICKKGKWILQRKFDWGEYVDASWDEAVNCNTFGNERIEKSVSRRIASLSKAKNRNLSCPVEKDSCAYLRDKYGKFSNKILHPLCYQVGMQ